MADAKHTPGPWEYSGGGIWGMSPWNARVRLADITFHRSTNGIASEANARLIAAAPDLLEAAQQTVWFIENGRELGFIPVAPSQPALDAARAAIAKALGEAT